MVELGPKQVARLQQLAFWLFLVSPGALPLVAWPLPFQDAVGHDGLIGGLYWLLVEPSLLDPALYVTEIAGPNRLFYVLPVTLGLVFGPGLGAQLGIAISIASVAPLAYLGLRVAKLDERWAVAVPPLVLGRILACGFLPNTMAMGPLCVVIGYCLAPSLPRRQTMILFVFAGLTAGIHSFLGFVVMGFLAATAGIDFLLRSRMQAVARAGCAIFVAALLAGPLAGHKPENSKWTVSEVIISKLVAPDFSRWERSLEWVMGWIRVVKWDDQLQWAWIVAVGSAIVLGVLRRDTRVLKLATFAAGCLAVLLTFGESFGPPVNWWGGWLRVPSIVALIAVFAAAFAAKRHLFLGNLAFVATLLVSLTIVAANLRYVGDAARVEYQGLLQVIDKAPPGKRICNLWYGDETTIYDFPGYPHLYVGSEYMLRKGGNASHSLFSNRNHMMFRKNHPVVQPHMGQAHGFNSNQHMAWCELFLVRSDLKNRNNPFSPQSRRQLHLIADEGRWMLWTKKK